MLQSRYCLILLEEKIKMKKKMILFMMLFASSLLFLSAGATAEEAEGNPNGYATIESIQNIKGLTCTVQIKTDKTRTYYIYRQDGQPQDYKFLRDHGCSTCALATVLNSVKGYNYTPAYVHKKLIPKKLGKKYTKPIKLYGIHKVLKKHKIYSKFVPRFRKASAKKNITRWLKKGGIAIVTVKSGADHKWTKHHHSFLLLGLKENGDVIVGDSAMENYQGNKRIKTAPMKGIVKYMIPCTSSRYTYCWPGTNTAGGYILTGDPTR